MNEIISYIIGKTIDSAPSFISSRLFPPRKIAPQIEIQLQGESPISINFTGAIPQVDLYFEMINHSYLSLTSNRMLIDVWFDQPTFQGAILKRYSIQVMKTTKNIRYTHYLSEAQKRYIEKFQSNTSSSGQIHIYITAYFESNSGLVEVQRTIERNRI